MAEPITQAEHARRCGVSRVAVTKWKAAGKLVMVGDRVDFDQSYKGENWHAGSQKARQPKQPAKPSAAPAKRAAPAPAPMPAAAPADAPEVVPNGATALKDAVTRKEEFTGRQRELDYLKAAGKLIDIEVARKVMFEEARTARDAWLNWVPRNAALIAADLGADAGKIAEVLTGYVHRQLSALGTPSGDFTQG